MKLAFVKRNWWFAGGVLATLLVGCLAVLDKENVASEKAPPEESVRVECANIETRPIAQRAYDRGVIRSLRRASLRFEVSGTIAEIGQDMDGNALAPGAQVEGPKGERPGRLLASLDDRERVILLRQAEAELREAQGRLKENAAAIARAQGEFDYAQIVFHRSEQLRRSRVTSECALDEAKRDFSSAKAGLDEAEEREGSLMSQVDICTARVEQARLNLERCLLRAPFDGVIADFKVRGSDLIHPEQFDISEEAARIRSAQIIVIDPSEYEVTVELALHKAEGIHKGLKAVIKPLRRESPVELEGCVTSVSPLLSATTKMVQVRIRCKPQGTTIFDGEYVSVSIDAHSVANALVLPRDALLYEDGKPYCFVLDSAKEVAHKVFPRLGLSDESGVQVIDGILPDTRVVTKGKERLRSGMAVIVNDGETP